MIRFYLVCFLVFQFLYSNSQIPTGYYNSAQGLTGIPLKQALHNIIKNHNSVSYSSLWSYFQQTDKKANGKVWDMYSDNPNGTPPYEYTYTSDQCGSYSGEGVCYNREHSWPQSWFNSNSPMVSDLFHLYPTDGYVNGKRGDNPYGNVGSVTWTSLNGSKLGYCNFPGYTGLVFEPIDEYKGDLARTYFYMSVRYYTEDGSWLTNDMVIKSDIKDWALKNLYEWHLADTVSQKEIDRNNKVYGIQNNRNPFIDHPEYVEMVWNTILGIQNHNENVYSFKLFPNPTTDNVNISINSKIDFSSAKINIYNNLGQKVSNSIIQEKNSKIDVSYLPKGFYLVSITIDDANYFERLFIE
ncbi:MAG: hypothetical protein A2033_14940 [Bacteroidetes bacterium GWA2_31_9]|nr:MAG: hypothetical protein A2033_14940 [Bacteroidetes bacterium GWA2_31_9]